MKNKLNSAKLLSMGVAALGVIGTILSNVVESNNRKEMKEEIKKELLDEISKAE